MRISKWSVENLVYPYMEHKKANKIRQKTEELMGNQGLPKEEIRKLQEGKLKALLLHCVQHVEAYKSFYFLKEKIGKDPRQALLSFPVLEKADFKKNFDLYLEDNANRNALIINETGGSSGEPVRFYMDKHTVEYYEAARWRGLRQWDISYGSPSVMLWGNPKETGMLSDKKYKFKERWLKNRIIIPAFELEPEKIGEYVGIINKFKPEYFYGYSSALETFARLMGEAGLKFEFKAKAAVSTAEMLHDYQRTMIEKVFECPVVNEYGARDGGIIAYECRKGNMHISEDNLILEAVGTGTFLLTDLNNYSMPRLRYKIGDMGILSAEECSCGINLSVLAELTGRESEMFVTKDGKLIHGLAFNALARETDSIKRFKIIQESPEKAKLIIVESKNSSPEEVREFIEKVGLKMPGTQFEVSFAEEIPLKTSGKIDYGSRDFKLPDIGAGEVES